MALRLVGVFAIVVAAVAVALAWSNLTVATEILLMETNGEITWQSPVTPDQFLVRSRLLAVPLCVSGFLTAIAGVAMIFRQRWGLHLTMLAALLVITFPWVTRIVASKPYQLNGPDLTDFLIGSIIGLVASLAFMFRPQRRIDA